MKNDFIVFVLLIVFAVPTFAFLKTVDVAQLVRAPDCDSGGRGFEPRLSPAY